MVSALPAAPSCAYFCNLQSCLSLLPHPHDVGSVGNYCDSPPLYSVVQHQKEDRGNVMVPFSGRACLLDII